MREDVAANATIKDRSERTIPLHPDLKAILVAWRAAQPDALLVIGTDNDTPNRKLLQTLKRAARNAGLNCGNCEGCKGPNECSRWYLHKFRATFTTTLLRSMGARSVMEITGHEDVENVLRCRKPLGRKEAAAKVANVFWS